MTMGEIQTSGGGITARNAHMSSIIINAVDGRHLMTIDLEKGTVTGELADVSEAGSRFMDYLNQQIGPLARNRITDLEQNVSALLRQRDEATAKITEVEAFYASRCSDNGPCTCNIRAVEAEARITELEEVIRRSAFREGSTEGALEEARAEITKLNRLLSSKLADTEAAEVHNRNYLRVIKGLEIRAEAAEAEAVRLGSIVDDCVDGCSRTLAAEARITRAMAAVMAATDPADYGPALEAVGRALTEVPE